MKPFIAAMVILLVSGCGVSSREPYAGWETYEDPGGRFTIRYLSPPWTACSGTEYEDACHECPAHLIGNGLCGGASNWDTLWVPPALLDPDFLLIPPYKLEVSWFTTSRDVLDLARAEGDRMTSAGLEEIFPARRVTLQDGNEAAEVAYRGSVAIVVDEDPADRPDEREYRVLYVNGGTLTFRVALDTAFDIEEPEARDMLASFSVEEEGS